MLFSRVLGAALQSVSVQASAKVAEVAQAEQTPVRAGEAFDLIGFVQNLTAAQPALGTDVAGAAGESMPSKPLDPLAALVKIGQMAGKGLTASQFSDAVAEDKGLKIQLFPTPDGAGVDTIRALPMITAADLEHAVSLLPASAEKDTVLSLIHDPQLIAAAMQASGLFPAQQMVPPAASQQSDSISELGVHEGQSFDASSALMHGAEELASDEQSPRMADPALNNDVSDIAFALAGQMPLQALPVQPFGIDATAAQPIPDGVLGAVPAVPMIAPQLMTGPWGNCQPPVLPDERFVRFIVPASDQKGVGPAASLLGPVTFETSLDTSAQVGQMGTDAVKGLVSTDASTSVLAQLARSFASSSDDTDSNSTKNSTSVVHADAPGLLDTPSLDLSSVASLNGSSGLAIADVGAQAEGSSKSTQDLFSSIFAKHGIPSAAESSTSHETAFAMDNAPSVDLNAFGLSPLSGGAFPVQPLSAQHATEVVANQSDDQFGDKVRSDLLKSLGAFKSSSSSGGLANQIFNSKLILDRATEEGLSLAKGLQASVGQEMAPVLDAAVAPSFASAGLDFGFKEAQLSARADHVINEASPRSFSNGGEQEAGQNQGRQDGQPHSQSSGVATSDILSANTPLNLDDVNSADNGLSKDKVSHQIHDEGHQTVSVSDAGAGDSASSAGDGHVTYANSAPLGSTSGSRESLMAVTYALSGRTPLASGSALASEMRFMSLGQQVMAALKQNSQEIELRLNPAQLGHVVLRLQVEGQKLSIQARTESQMSDDALILGEDGLRSSLAAHGYHLDKFDVSHQDERRKSNRPDQTESRGPDASGDDPFSFDLIA